MRTGCRDGLQEIREGGEARGRGGSRGALVVERAVSEKGELRAVIGKFVDLAVIELERAYHLRRLEEPTAAAAQAAVGRECRVLRKPAGDCRRSDRVPVAGRYFARGLRER